jgi:hypothetical protein
MILEGAEGIVKEEVLKEYLCTICFRNSKYLIIYPSKLCVMVNDAFATNIFGLLCRTKITSVLSCVQDNESLDRLYSITQSYRFEEKEIVGLLCTTSTQNQNIY